MLQPARPTALPVLREDAWEADAGRRRDVRLCRRVIYIFSLFLKSYFFRVGFKYEEEEISFVYSSLFTPTFLSVLFGKIPSIHKNEKS